VLTCLAAAAVMAGAGAVHADAVVDWNQIASDTIAVAPGRPGPSTVLDFATVQVAVYDAVVAIEGRFQPYHVSIPNAHGSSAAAAAKAARDVLVNRVPSQAATVDAKYAAYLASHGLEEDDPGVEVGAQAAAGIIAFRAGDGSFPAMFPPFTGGTGPGEWRPTPNYLPPGNPAPGNQPMAAPWLATVRPFTLNDSSQLRPGPPPPLKSGRYTKDYDEVKALGALEGSERTDEQTDLAYFYSGNLVIQFNRLVRTVATANVQDIADSARLFALATTSVADAIIGSWDSKIAFNLWRPVTAIQEGDNDGNSKTAGDPDWKPLINTPPYPEYTSGANNASGATARALALFFGTEEIEFDVTTDVAAATTKTRHYTCLSTFADDLVEARILLGIHFRTADVVARKTGEKAAQWAFRHHFRPVRGHGNDH
jgi:hypothetical protein